MQPTTALGDDDSVILSNQLAVSRLQPGSRLSEVGSSSVAGRAGTAACSTRFFTPADASSLSPEQIQNLVFFKIISNNLNNHTFLGEVHVQDVDCMVQIYKVVDCDYNESKRKLESLSVVPVPTKIQAATWSLPPTEARLYSGCGCMM